MMPSKSLWEGRRERERERELEHRERKEKEHRKEGRKTVPSLQTVLRRWFTHFKKALIMKDSIHQNLYS